MNKIYSILALICIVIPTISASDSKWLPGKITSYSWQRGEWTDETETLVSYDEYGNVISKVSLDQTVTFEYDPIVHDFVIKQTIDYGVFTIIAITDVTRNSDGNITEIRTYMDGNDPFMSAERVIEIKYDSDGKAIEISDYKLSFGDKRYEQIYSDIEWEKTDGQITDVNVLSCLGASYFGSNRIKSAMISGLFYNPVALNVDYDSDNTGFHSVLTMDKTKVAEYNYKPLDNYNSYEGESYYVEFYEDDDTEQWEVDYAQSRTIECYKDDYGLTISSNEKIIYHIPEEKDKFDERTEKGIITYDLQYGYPVEYIKQIMYDPEIGLVNSARRLYSDYSISSSIKKIEEDENNIEYYNLQGVKVNNPSKGYYILRKGSKSCKVLVR